MEQLPEGTRVLITWSGGNGPHKYITRVNRFGARYFAVESCPDVLVGVPFEVATLTVLPDNKDLTAHAAHR